MTVSNLVSRSLRRKPILWVAGLAFGALWLRRMVEWWGNPAAMVAFSIPPLGGFLVVYLLSREQGPVRPLPNVILRRSPLVDVGLLVGLAVLADFSPKAAIFPAIILTAAALFWAGYCDGRADAYRTPPVDAAAPPDLAR